MNEPIFHAEPEKPLAEKSVWSETLANPWKNLAEAYPGLENRVDFLDLQTWFKNAVIQLPNFDIVDIPLENTVNEDSNSEGGKWIATYSPAAETRGQISEIRRLDSQFFKLKGIKCIKSDPQTGKVNFEWTQPVLEGGETPLTVKLFGREIEVPVYGLLATIKDSEGHFLLTVGQEPMSENEKHSTVRLPVQASATKVALTIAGAPGGDAGLAELMKIYGCKNMDEIVNKADDVLFECPEDLDRIIKHNLILVMPTIESRSDLHQDLISDSKRKWVTKEQLEMIALSGLANSHTTGCTDLAEKSARLRELTTSSSSP